MLGVKWINPFTAFYSPKHSGRKYELQEVIEISKINQSYSVDMGLCVDDISRTMNYFEERKE